MNVRTAIVAVVLALVVGVTAAVAVRSGGLHESAVPAARAALPSFSHVIVVVFENEEYDKIIGDSDAPTFNRLAKRYALLANYTGVTHPSLPNYLALISGSTQGIEHNCSTCTVDARNLADTLDGAHKTWKMYAEGLPSPGFTGKESGDYAKKHNPFVYFDDILSRPDRLARVVRYDQFGADLSAGKLPNYAMVVPDLCHSMHDCPVEDGDAWLDSFIQPLLRSPLMKGSVVFVTFDEGDSDEGGGGRVATIAIGPTVRRGAGSGAALNHYGLLRTIEDAWRLPLLADSATATAITGIWK